MEDAESRAGDPRSRSLGQIEDMAGSLDMADVSHTIGYSSSIEYILKISHCLVS